VIVDVRIGFAMYSISVPEVGDLARCVYGGARGPGWTTGIFLGYTPGIGYAMYVTEEGMRYTRFKRDGIVVIPEDEVKSGFHVWSPA
jgi:hypothetical protein